MSLAGKLLEFYLEANLLLVVSYIFFRASRVVVAKFKRRIVYRSLNRVAQVLILTSVLAPALFALMPRENLPVVNFRVLNPLPEGIFTQTSKPKISPVQRIEVAEKPLSPVTVVMQWKAIFDSLKKLVGQFQIFILLGLIEGSLVAWVRLARNLVSLKGLLADAIIIRQIGKVCVLVSDSAAVPFATWVGGRASVVVPANVLTKPRDFRIILRHEFQHHRNGDTIWILALEAAVCLFYLNPAIYLWRKEVIEIQEFSCDEMLIGQMGVSLHEYGSCLVRVAEAALGSHQLQVGTTCMGAAPENPRHFKPFLRRRIEVFRNHQSSKSKGVLGYALGTLCLFCTVGVAYGAQQVLRSQPASHAPNSGQAQFDPAIQATSEQILQEQVRKTGATGGFVLVSDTRSGRLLAAANVSHYPQQKGKAWSLSYLMEPASSMKGIVIASALDHQLTTPEEMHNCGNGSYSYGGRVYHDWKPYQELSTAGIVARSSNICGIKIGEKLGVSGRYAVLVFPAVV